MTTFKLATHFSQLGHDIGVFSFEKSGHIDQSFAELFASPESGGPKNPRNIEAMEYALAAFQPDVIIHQMPYEHRVGDALRKFRPKLLLGCLRNTLFSVKNNLDLYGKRVLPKALTPFFRNPVGRYLLLRKHRRRHRHDLQRILDTYDYFVMFGPPNLDELRYFVPEFAESRIKLIPNSIPSVLDQPPEKDKRILWLGRLSNIQKRADLIIPLWRRISAALPDWELDIVGGGPELEVIRKEISLGELERVTVHGQQVPDNYFRQASIYLMTSTFEGFPNTLVEAQSFGAVPVIFNSYPVAKWIIDDEVNGYLIRPYDVDAMADRVISLATDGRLSNLMVESLKNASRFQVDAVGRIWQELFSECLLSTSCNSTTISENVS